MDVEIRDTYATITLETGDTFRVNVKQKGRKATQEELRYGIQSTPQEGKDLLRVENIEGEMALHDIVLQSPMRWVDIENKCKEGAKVQGSYGSRHLLAGAVTNVKLNKQHTYAYVTVKNCLWNKGKKFWREGDLSTEYTMKIKLEKTQKPTATAEVHKDETTEEKDIKTLFEEERKTIPQERVIKWDDRKTEENEEQETQDVVDLRKEKAHTIQDKLRTLQPGTPIIFEVIDGEKKATFLQYLPGDEKDSFGKAKIEIRYPDETTTTTQKKVRDLRFE